MSKSLFALSDEGLQDALRAAAREVAYPPTPALAKQVRMRLETAPRSSHRTLPHRPRWQPALVALGALVVVLVATMTFSPRAREAVADFIGVGGVRIGFDERAPSATPSEGLNLGPRVSLAEAEELAGFDVKVPQMLGLSSPEIHFIRPPDAGMVSLLYPDAYEGADEPALLITQFRADLDGAFVKKLGFEGTDVESVLVRGSVGYWVRGAHVFSYVDASGNLREETLRLADNVLLWEEDGITYRIEGGFGRPEALKIADSLTD